MVMDQDPMETLPAPDVVGREFVRQYYTLLNEAPEHAHRFYNSNSYFVHGTMTKPAIGQVEIHQKIQQLNFRDIHAKISQVDSQVTLGNGVVVQVSGELSNNGLPMRRFSQTFVLGTQSPKKYYVHNDIFRYQDMLQSDEETDTPPEKEDHQEIEPQEAMDYYQSVPQEQSLPPQQPIPTGLNVNAPPHTVNVNGTGGGLPHEEPMAVPEPVLPVTAVPPEPAPAPVVMNGGISMMAGEDLGGRVAPPSAPVETVQTPLSHSSSGHMVAEESTTQTVSEVVNKDVYEDDSYRGQSMDSNEQKVTFANLFRNSPRGGRGAPPSRAVRNTPPPQSASQAPLQTPQGAPPPPRSEGGSDAPSGYPRYSDSQQIFMGNIPIEATESELKPLFEVFGRVIDVRINPNRTRDSTSKNYGFVTFEDSTAVANCLKNKHIMCRDVIINVEEKKRHTKPGGGGGRGEPGHESGGWSMGRGQSSGRGSRPSRGAPRGGSSFSRGPPPATSRPPYSSKR